MTDLLGTCLSWSETACVVAPEDGPPVTIPLSLIVSGKPVPPRPSVRLRVSPAEAQHRAFALFPDLVTRPLGDWVLRTSATATARRANSVLAFGDPGVTDPVAAVRAFYEARGRRPVAAVLAGTTHPFDGWVPESTGADTEFQVVPVSRARRLLREVPEADVDLEEEGDLVTARIGDRAAGVAAYADDWVGFRSVEVSPDHRRRGLALAVMDALLEWGAERGATTACLQVIGDNAPALELYARLGFTTHHTYRYLAPAERTSNVQ
jgi:GNAT superfamily N-acetyltransferase